MLENNPLAEQDLQLIISTFEKGMIQSEDESSIYAGFRRDLVSVADLPNSVIKVIDMLPGVDNKDEDEENVEIPDNTESNDEEDEDDSWKKKAVEALKECIPCDMRFVTEFDADFGKDLGDGWENTFDQIAGNLDGVDKLFESDDSILKEICSIANKLKIHCGSDLKKINLVLGMLLKEMKLQISVDISFVDDLIMSVLSPLFNELVANLDIIDKIALGPIRCILNQLKYQLEQGDQAVIQGREMAEDFIDTGENAQRTAQARRENIQNTQRQQQQRRQAPRALDSMTNALDEIEDEASLDRLEAYLERGMTYIKQKKDYLINILKELVQNGTERWNQRVDFAEGKRDLLRLISTVKGLIETIAKGEMTCGDPEEMTEEELNSFIAHFIPSSPTLEVSIQDDILVVERSQPNGTVATDITGGTVANVELRNFVVRRPISSCLKKITSEQVDQAQVWISLLE